MNTRLSHRVWTYACLVWVLLVALLTTVAAIQWQLGIARDSDMAGIQEVILVFLIVSSGPAAVVAFGVFAPIAIVADRLIRGRARRVATLVVGALLGLVPFVLFVIASALLRGTPVLPLSPGIGRLLPNPSAIALAVFCVLSGIVAGMVLRHPRHWFAAPPAQQHRRR